MKTEKKTFEREVQTSPITTSSQTLHEVGMLVWFLPVVAEVVLSSEGLVTDITGIWPLVRVCPLVDQQVVRFGKMAATELADKLFLGLRGQSASAGLALR